MSKNFNYKIKNKTKQEYILSTMQKIEKFNDAYLKVKANYILGEYDGINLNHLFLSHPQSKVITHLMEMLDCFDGSNSYDNIGYIKLIELYIDGLKNADEVLIQPQNILGIEKVLNDAIYYLSNIYDYLTTVDISNDEPDFDYDGNKIVKLVDLEFLGKLQNEILNLINILGSYKEKCVFDKKTLDNYPELSENGSELNLKVYDNFSKHHTRYVENNLIRAHQAISNKIIYEKPKNSSYIENWINTKKISRRLRKNNQSQEEYCDIHYIDTKTFDELLNLFTQCIDDSLFDLDNEIISYSSCSTIFAYRNKLKNNLIKFYKKYQEIKDTIKPLDEQEENMLKNFEDYLTKAIDSFSIKLSIDGDKYNYRDNFYSKSLKEFIK